MFEHRGLLLAPLLVSGAAGPGLRSDSGFFSETDCNAGAKAGAFAFFPPGVAAAAALKQSMVNVATPIVVPESGHPVSETRVIAATAHEPPPETRPRSAHVLLADPDREVLEGLRDMLTREGHRVDAVSGGVEALRLLGRFPYDMVICDVDMPGINGIALLHRVQEEDPYLPVVLITANPAVGTAMQAVEYGAFHYLTKPVADDLLSSVVARGMRVLELSRVTQQAARMLGIRDEVNAARSELTARFERALASLWMAYQPILDAATGEVFGYEALLRSSEPSLPHPGAVLDAATRLGTLTDLGRVARVRAAQPILEQPQRGTLFVNLHVTDLLDTELYDLDSPLCRIADRVVLEITERAPIDSVRDLEERVRELRALGFRIAVDDLGAGYAGLSSFALLEPEIVKLDMSLVRDVDTDRVKQKVVGSMVSLAHDMGMLVVAEGVETEVERDELVRLGCDLLQGYWFAKPDRPFPGARW